jgi:hypothetical protein
MPLKLRAVVVAGPALSAMAAGIVAAQPPQYDPRYEPPRTPWGDPDLQGKWPGTAMVGVPMRRNPEFEERNQLTEQEYQQEVLRRGRQAETDLADFELENADSTPGYVAIRNEMIHEARLIPVDGQPHADPAIRMWMGDSRGRSGSNRTIGSQVIGKL